MHLWININYTIFYQTLNNKELEMKKILLGLLISAISIFGSGVEVPLSDINKSPADLKKWESLLDFVKNKIDIYSIIDHVYHRARNDGRKITGYILCHMYPTDKGGAFCVIGEGTFDLGRLNVGIPRELMWAKTSRYIEDKDKDRYPEWLGVITTENNGGYGITEGVYVIGKVPQQFRYTDDRRWHKYICNWASFVRDVPRTWFTNKRAPANAIEFVKYDEENKPYVPMTASDVLYLETEMDGKIMIMDYIHKYGLDEVLPFED